MNESMNEVSKQIFAHDLPIMIIVVSSLMALGLLLMVVGGIYCDIKEKKRKKQRVQELEELLKNWKYDQSGTL